MTHLYIEQDTGSIEEVSMSIISKLYDLASSGDLDNASDLKGRLHSSSARDTHINYLNNNFNDLHITADKVYMTFADPVTEAVLTRYLGDGTGVTAAMATAYSGIFQDQYTNPNTGVKNNLFANSTEKTSISSFNELVLFTGVTTIGQEAFKGCSSLSSINLDNIQYITMSAFQNSGISGIVNLPSLVRFLGRYNNYNYVETGWNFAQCPNITEVNIGSSFDRFGGTGTFIDCSGLTKVTGLSNINYIPSSTFSGCTNLASVDIDWSKITYISDSVFYKCSHLSPVSLSLPNLQGLGGRTFRQSGIQSITSLGSDITEIPYEFCMQCDNLTSVTLPNTITTIKYDAFRYCNNLASINVPSSCTTIESHAFEDNWNWDTTLDLSNITTLGAQIFKECKKLVISNFPRISTYQGSNFIYIANTSITIPKEVVTIDGNCFQDCRSLQTLTFESNSQLTTLGNGAFWRCFNLQSIVLPEGLTTIGGQCFRECNIAYTVDIPSTVTTIGSGAFDGIGSLNNWSHRVDAIFRSTTPPTLSGDIFGRNSGQLATLHIYVPDASVNAYKAATTWSTYASCIKGISELPS